MPAESITRETGATVTIQELDDYDANIVWLAKAGELMGTAASSEEFKAGQVDAFPDLGMVAAIDFVLPFLFPSDDSGALESD